MAYDSSTTHSLFGFEEIEHSLLKGFKDSKLHHALLFSGNEGIGKFSFALALARKIILTSSENHDEDFQKITSRTHPDLLIIQREIGAKQELKKDISIDQIRKIHEFVNLTAAISKYRIIIIDAIDQMNKNGCNALLKVLEEPPTNIFIFIINHNFGKLQITIKSRCNIIKIKPLNYLDWARAVTQNNSSITSNEQLKNLFIISEGSVASALELYANNGLDLYDNIATSLAQGEISSSLLKLSEKLSAKDFDFSIFEKIINFYFNRIVMILSGVGVKNYLSQAEENSLVNFAFKTNLEKVFSISDKVNKLLAETRNLNLDKKQSTINVFNTIFSA